MTWLYLLSYLEEERELAEAELWALTSAEARGDRLVRAAAQADVTGAAHVSLCVAEMASAGDLDGLRDRVAALGLAMDGFRVRVVKVPGSGADRRDDLPDSPVIAQRIADVIGGRVDLQRPQREFVCFLHAGDCCFGALCSRADRSWVRRQAKPHSYSNSLPVRLARAMVNMAAQPGQWVIDPCCGVGTLLVEAESVGIHAAGCDLNKKMTSPARDNLLHFGLPARVFAGDARTVGGRFDAVVTDLPYGWTSAPDEGLYEEVLENAVRLAPRLCVVAGKDIGTMIEAAGYRLLRHAKQPKRRGTRHVFVAEVLHSI